MDSSELMLYLSKKLDHLSKNISKTKDILLISPNEENLLVKKKYINDYMNELKENLTQASLAIKALVSEIKNLLSINEELSKKCEMNINKNLIIEDQSKIIELSSLRGAKDVIKESKDKKKKIHDAVFNHFNKENKNNSEENPSKNKKNFNLNKSAPNIKRNSNISFRKKTNNLLEEYLKEGSVKNKGNKIGNEKSERDTYYEGEYINKENKEQELRDKKTEFKKNKNTGLTYEFNNYTSSYGKYFTDYEINNQKKF